VIVEGFYRVAGGLVYVESFEGQPLGSAAYQSGDDVEFIARRLLKKGGGGDGFWAAISYPHRATH